MLTSYGSEGQLLVNFSSSHDFDFDIEGMQERCNQAIELILAHPKRKALTSEMHECVRLLIESGGCLHPEFFLVGDGQKIHNGIVESFVLQSPLGFSLLEALIPVGLYAAVERRKGPYKELLKHKLLKVIAAFAMMINGAEHIDELPRELIFDVIGFFRTPDRLRWRNGFLGSDEIGTTCFREFTRALGEYLKDNDLLAQAAHTRVWSSASGRTWKAIVKNPTPLENELLVLYREYARDSLSKQNVDRQVVMDAIRILSGNGEVSLVEASKRQFPSNAFVELYKSRVGTLRSSSLTSIRQARRLSEYIVTYYTEKFPGEVFHPLVTEKEVNFVANALSQTSKRRSQAAARPMAERFHYLAKQILQEGAFGWPGQTFTYERRYGDEVRREYCPVLPTLLLAMLELPLRAVQFRRFDSGEGDLRCFNGSTMCWETNKGPHAGYWLKNGLTTADETRGYAYEYSEESPSFTGFFVNTNKTGEPYAVPWMADELHRLLWSLAEWQRTHNPVEGPVEPIEYLDEERPEATVKALPAIFALFRMPPSSKNPARGIPPSATVLTKAFLAWMLEVERRWNELNPDDHVTIITKFGENGQPQKCAYTLHGIRVRGITNLHRAGVPIELISKMVAGHATVAMTIYYLNRSPSEVCAMLDKAMSASCSAEITSWINELKDAKLAEARRKTTYVEEETVTELQAADRNLFSNVDIGVCPHDGTRCEDGGERRRADSTRSKNVHGPVRPSRNCIMCRHFVSGTPFILQLELYGSKLLWRRKQLSKKIREHSSRLAMLHSQKESGAISRHTFRLQADSLRAENTIMKNDVERLDEAIFRVRVHLTAASKILQSEIAAGQQPSVALVASDAAATVEYVEFSEFDFATILTQASQFWSILHDDALETTKRQFIDSILWKNDEVPITMRADLSDMQRRAASDVMARYLVEQVSYEDRMALTRGDATLRDMSLDYQVRNLMDRVSLAPVGLDTARAQSARLLMEIT